jgi:PAS domain S-box-containing protein
MNDGLIVLLPGGVIAYSNRAFAELLGTTLEEVVGSFFTRFLPAEQWPAFKSLEEETGKCSPWREFTLCTGEGKLVPVRLSARQAEDNPHSGICLVISDLTEQRKREETQAYLAAIVESSEDAIIGLTLHGVITSWNRGAQHLYGYTGEEVIGRSIELLVPVSHAGDVANYLERVRLGEAIEQYETVRVRKDGRELQVSLSVSPLRDAAGSVIGASTIAHDITERKKAERALARRTEELARSNAELQQFAYVSSHDLREPLRTVANFAQLLQERYSGKLDATGDEFIGFIVDGVTRMQGLINDLLAYSRAGSHGRNRVPVDCGALLRQALGNLRAAIEESGAQISHDELPVIRCDGAQVTQVFQNLVGNSIKFRNGPPPRIHVAVERAPAEWVFSVKDNGIGIDPRYASRIFEIFQRLHTQKKYPGSGVGLAIAKKIVERHGGRMWVESKLHQGATFFFTLPASSGRDAQQAKLFELTEGGGDVPNGLIPRFPALSITAHEPTPVPQGGTAAGSPEACKGSGVDS